MNEAGIWEQMTKIRESQARTEAMLDMLAAQLPLINGKQDTMELRVYALEQAKISTRAEIDAAAALGQQALDSIAAYELPAPFFKKWKAEVDEAVKAIGSLRAVTTIKRDIRRADFALIAAAGAVGTYFIAQIPRIIDIIDRIGG